jgi:hypothetical protein
VGTQAAKVLLAWEVYVPVLRSRETFHWRFIPRKTLGGIDATGPGCQVVLSLVGGMIPTQPALRHNMARIIRAQQWLWGC